MQNAEKLYFYLYIVSDNDICDIVKMMDGDYHLCKTLVVLKKKKK